MDIAHSHFNLTGPAINPRELSKDSDLAQRFLLWYCSSLCGSFWDSEARWSCSTERLSMEVIKQYLPCPHLIPQSGTYHSSMEVNIWSSDHTHNASNLAWPRNRTKKLSVILSISNRLDINAHWSFICKALCRIRLILESQIFSHNDIQKNDESTHSIALKWIQNRLVTQQIAFLSMNNLEYYLQQDEHDEQIMEVIRDVQDFLLQSSHEVKSFDHRSEAERRQPLISSANTTNALFNVAKKSFDVG